MRKALSIILIIAVLFAQITFIFSCLPMKAEASGINFKCGENATWSLDEYGVLTISGTGDMYNFESQIYYEAPWNEFRSSIKKVVIEEGITNIGQNAFQNCYSATDLHIASSVEVIEGGSLGYSGKNNFDRITIGENSMLRAVNGSALDYTRWFEKKPDYQPVYLGRMLYTFKGPPPSDYFTVNVKEGTVAISPLAFYNKKLGNITFPDSLVYVGGNAFYNTQWLKNQPVGPVYAGNILVGYSGEVPLTETNFEVKEGTVCIAGTAFYKSDRITSITIPASVQYIGNSAFNGCKNLEEVVFAENSQLKLIDTAAFNECTKLSVLDLPESTEQIGNYAFRDTRLTHLHFSEKLKKVGNGAAQDSDIKKITIDENNTHIFVDKESVVYTGDKKALIFSLNAAKLTEYSIRSECKVIRPEAFMDSPIKKVTFNEGLEYIDNEAFYFSKLESISLPGTIKALGLRAFSWCRNNKSITLAEGITDIGNQAFSINPSVTQIVFPDSLELIGRYSFDGCSALTKAVIPAITGVSYGAFDSCKSLTIYCYENSPAHTHATKYDIPFVLIDDTVDDTEIKDVISRANEIDRTLYTPESLAKLDEALGGVDLEAEGLTQEKIDAWCNAIEKATNELQFKPADYASVDDVKLQAESINRSYYTPESLAELDKALSAVDYNLTIDKQAQVAEWAKAIENAIENLEYLPADYSAVNAEINKVENLDRRYYSEISLIALDSSINAVEYGLNITEQAKVDAFAESISNAISTLEYASIVLRHEPCGVIVSATAKEIKPDTILAVEEVDPTNYEGTNFAVGGSIRSLHFYDINLVYETVIVQPDGTVTVKIKLADGVDPKKCKVYHVTEDIVNPLVRFASTIDGNYIVFETDHFSEFAVIEVETVVDSVEVLSMPAKAEYGIGEPLDLTGLKVIAYYSDGTSKEISDYNVGMVNLNSIGKKRITVYYTFGSITKTAEFEITVSAQKCSADITENGKAVERINKKLGLFAFYTKASVQLDCSIKNADGCTVRWMSDNSKVLVDKNGKVTCKGLFGAKKANITVEVVDEGGNVVARDTVFVIFYKLSFQLSNTMSQEIGILKRNITLW